MSRRFMTRDRTLRLIWTLLSLVIAVVFLFPLYWIITSSVKTNAEIFMRPPTLFPQTIIFEPFYGQLHGTYSVIRSSRNSFIIATSSMLFSFLLAAPAAYGISRFRLPGARLMIMVFLVTQMLPSSLLLTPMFLTFSNLGLLNTYTAPVLATATITIPFTLLILRPMFMSYPKEIEESARIDGCSRLQAFMKVVAPIIKPGLVTVLCFGFVHGWNDLMFSLTFNTRRELFPMTSAIFGLMNEFGTRWNWVMAYGVMLTIPPITIFIFAQKYVIGGLARGAVKG